MKGIYTNSASSASDYDDTLDGDEYTQPPTRETEANVREINTDTEAEPNDEAWEEIDTSLSAEPNPGEAWEDDTDTTADTPDTGTESDADDLDIPAHTDTETDASADAWIGIAVQAGLDETYARKLNQAGLLAETVQRELARQKAAPTETPDENKPDTMSDDQFMEFIGLSTDDEWDPNIIKAFRTLHDQHQQELSEIKSQVTQQSEEKYYNWFDDQISKLGNDFSDVFGKGTRNELDPTSVHAKNRVAVLEQMEVLRAGYQALGRQVPEPQVFQAAVRAVHGDKLKSVATDSIKNQLKNRQSQRVPRPSKRDNSTAPTTKEERERAMLSDLESKMREMGITNDRYGTVKNP